MKKAVLIGLAIVTLMMLEALTSTGQVKQGKTRLIKTKQLMQGLNKLHCGALGEGLKEEPTDDDAWEALAVNAAMLNEASYVLMADGRCPDGDWADAAAALGEGSAHLLAHIEDHDYEGSKAAFGEMTKSCGACHEAHKE